MVAGLVSACACLMYFFRPVAKRQLLIFDPNKSFILITLRVIYSSLGKPRQLGPLSMKSSIRYMSKERYRGLLNLHRSLSQYLSYRKPSTKARKRLRGGRDASWSISVDLIRLPSPIIILYYYKAISYRPYKDILRLVSSTIAANSTFSWLRRKIGTNL